MKTTHQFTESTGPERLVTTRQIAAHAQVSQRTVANWRATRRIPFIRINARNVRYRLSEVEAALRNGT
jgi:predicted DNA-binding transcriptional regulator AlpA